MQQETAARDVEWPDGGIARAAGRDVARAVVNRSRAVGQPNRR